ncbi:hypothetical protein ACOMHN_000086 [Nucella lapillus]
MFRCKNKQCIPVAAACNHHVDCLDTSDEKKCGIQIPLSPDQKLHHVIINFDGTGVASYQRLNINDPSSCPETHFTCLGHSYCLPLYVRCNQVSDCLTHEMKEGVMVTSVQACTGVVGLRCVCITLTCVMAGRSVRSMMMSVSVA